MEEKNENVLKTVNVYGQLIPLKEILKIFFEIPNVFEKIYKYITTLNENTDDEICNIVQTSFWKSKILNNESITFPLFLYEDAFETANPLGSHAGIYKLCGMYISIPCLPPELSSRLDNIFLAQLYHADDTKLFSKKQIYSYLIRDLMILETEGIQLSIGSKNIQVYFKLALIIGDNLRLHGILGFVESFSANLCCRFCKISKDISRKPCSEDINLLRNKINYAQDIAINKVTITGLKESCAFNVLKSFHAVENYSVDIMHDLLESTSEILYYFIVQQQYFTLDTLNWRLQFFNFDSMSNRPPTISLSQLLNKSIKMSAAEMLCFILNAGLIFGDLITNPNDKYWSLYKLLRKILSITLQYSVTKSTADLLESLINEHHMLYIDLFGETLKSKHHLMLHYPRVMNTVGSLRPLWSMRFEAKHRPLKQYAQATASRRDICYSIAVKQQLMLSNLFMTLQLNNLPYVTYKESNSLVSLKNVILNNYTNYITLKSICFGNVVLKKGSIVLVNIDNDGYSLFVEISYIFKKKTNIVSLSPSNFITTIKYLFATYFDDHYQAYTINISDKYDTISFNSLVYFKV
ncbi:hypothetical protein ALC60_06949 [Trachymyrmex zeteki]|uniref:Uncharacterized protein n=1 Tax=Mycetomoellerius zeteki TaxID=64791 RepID=A0A151X169_9HYME|nr:hypothetical protein ALC60_06949 [Trachymyrmex zeteki]